MGRPPAMRLEDSDCKYPEIDVIEDQKEGELGCMSWLCLLFRVAHTFHKFTLGNSDTRLNSFLGQSNMFSTLEA